MFCCRVDPSRYDQYVPRGDRHTSSTTASAIYQHALLTSPRTPTVSDPSASDVVEASAEGETPSSHRENQDRSQETSVSSSSQGRHMQYERLDTAEDGTPLRRQPQDHSVSSDILHTSTKTEGSHSEGLQGSETSQTSGHGGHGEAGNWDDSYSDIGDMDTTPTSPPADSPAREVIDDVYGDVSEEMVRTEYSPRTPPLKLAISTSPPPSGSSSAEVCDRPIFIELTCLPMPL